VSNGIAATPLMIERNSEITAAVVRERSRLGSFIRRRVRDPSDAEDLLQDVLQEFVEAYRLPEPIEQVSAWLFRVARNRIVDRFRKKRDRLTIEMIEESAPGDYVLHFDTLGYVLVCTTLVSLTFMYVIDRTIRFANK
jgi:RNA polymerase sigma factor (sigma-70 family)